MENGTSYLTSCLADFFATVPHKETKTTEKYRLLSGTLTFKKGTTNRSRSGLRCRRCSTVAV